MANRKFHLRGFMRALRGHGAGQALVETALTVPMLIVVLIGAAELARVAYMAIEVSNAASAAVRYGAQNGTTAVDSAGMELAATQDAFNLPSTAPLHVTPTSACFCASAPSGSVTCTDETACTGTGDTMEKTLTVTTSATFDPLIHLPFLPRTFTLHGQAIQRVLN